MSATQSQTCYTVRLQPQAKTAYQYQPDATTAPRIGCQHKRHLRIITRLASYPQVKVINDINVILDPIGSEGDNFVASFEKANIHASGNTPEEAMCNLTRTLVEQFEAFTANEDSLSGELQRQLAMLREHLEEVTDGKDHHP